MAPPCQSQWVLCDLSMNHLMTPMDSIVRVSYSHLVPFRYFNALLSFPQSSSSGSLTLVVKKYTAVWMSLLARELRNSNWAVVWWNAIAFYSGRYFASLASLTLNRWSTTGVAAFPVINYGNSSMMLSRYWNIDTYRLPLSMNLKYIPR